MVLHTSTVYSALTDMFRKDRFCEAKLREHGVHEV